MPYLGDAYNGLGAVQFVDYDSNDDNGTSPEYRTLTTPDEGTQNKAIAGSTTDRYTMDRGSWTMTANYKLGWTDTSDWMNYTRTFPDGAYEVLAGMSHGGTGATDMRGTLDLVTSDPTQPDQTLQALGKFVAQGTGQWSRNAFVRMTDAADAIAVINLSGEQTLRFTADSGDFDYLWMVPSSGVTPGYTIGPISLDPSGDIMIEFTGTLLEPDAIGGPYAPVDGATSPYMVTPTAGETKFYQGQE